MYTWIHQGDSRLDVRMAEAVGRTPGRTAWALDAECIADLRYLELATLYSCSLLSATPPITQQDGLTYIGDFTDTWRGPFHRQAATALCKTWLLLAGGKTPSASKVYTQDSGDVGNPWALAVIAVAGIGAVTGALCYVAEKAAPVIDRYLMQSAEYQKLVATQAQMLALAQIHAAREAAAGGGALPPDPVTAQVLGDLSATQKKLSTSAVPPAGPPSDPPSLSTILTVGAVGVGGLLLWNALKG